MKKLIIFTLVLTLAVSASGCSSMLETLNQFKPHRQPTEPSTQATVAPTETEEPTLPVAENNSYFNCYVSHDDYVLPGSDTTYFGRAALTGLTDAELVIARQEIYARHGREFSDPELREYFTARSWYSVFAETDLNDCEKSNLALLDAFEAQKSGEVRSNRYIRHMTDSNNYAMADSNSRYLRASDLSNLEHDHLVIIRNEIYARHGYIFNSDSLQEYFFCTDWYTPDPEFSTKSFNKYENANLTMCKLYEQKLEGVEFSSKNPYKAYYNGPDTAIIPNSCNVYLTEYDLWYLSTAELKLARNEILARNGYTFKDKNLLEFFLQCDWYKPDTPPGSKSGMKLSDTEEHNIELIKSFEE